MMPFTTRILTAVALLGIGLTYLWHQSASVNERWSAGRHGASAKVSTLSQWRAQFDGLAQKVFQSSADGALSAPATTGSDAHTIRQRVVAVADLHGDFEHAYNVLRMAQLIDKDVNWIGGQDVFVSTGDIVDRGDDTIALYELFQHLRTQAAAVGGKVLNCLGNHEIMNAMMDWRYVTPGDLDSFGGPQQRRLAMSDKGWIGQEWLANYSITHTVALLPPARVPSSLVGKYDVPSASFVHGGIHPEWASRGVEKINEVGHSLLHKSLSSERPNGWLPPNTTDIEKALYNEHGPLWYRGYALEEEDEVCREADEARERLQVRHLVFGHTPHLSGFVSRCQSSVLLIDTGISRAYGGEQSALIFETHLLRDGGKGGAAAVWKEESTITALYRGRTPKVIDSRVRQIPE